MSAQDKIKDSLNWDGGVFTIEVIRDGKHGPEVIEKREAHNLVVAAGKIQIWRVASGINAQCFDQMRIGTSDVAPTAADTNLKSPVTGTLNTVDVKTMTGVRTFQLVISYPSGGATKSATGISEVCILSQNTSPGGVALARATFTAVNKTTADKLNLTQCVMGSW